MCCLAKSLRVCFTSVILYERLVLFVALLTFREADSGILTIL